MNRPDIKHRLCIQDIVLMIGVLAGSFWVLGAFSRAADDGQTRLLVYQDGAVVRDVFLNQAGIIDLKVAGGQMSIEVNPHDGARVAHSDCPAHICVHTGWIKQPGETSICIPNRVLLEIAGAKGGYHAVTY